MPPQVRKIKDVDLLLSEQALKRAAKKALEIGELTNTPVYVYQDGEIIDIRKTYTKDK